ncbi:MAG: ABC transporter substrate-binding protein [Desulfobacteraceae bacterium]|nr:ABC transporter substrate-binding protein [Desulfobacteraceae bacterium]
MKHKIINKQSFFQYAACLIAISGFFILGLLLAAETNARTITDMADRKVIIKGSVEKIVTTFKPSTLCMLSLGLQHKLIGVDSTSKRDRLSLAVFPGITDVKGIGSKAMGINFETLVSLKPDLVILYTQKDGLSLADRLNSIGIPSIIIFPETFETIKESIRLIANAAGELEKAESVVKQMDTMTSLLEQRLVGLSIAEKKTGYFASSRGLFSTTTKDMLQDEIFNKAGILNVSHDLSGYFQDISPEQLIKWNPDIMVFSQHMKKSETKRLDNQALKKIAAVSEKTVYRCPSSLAPWDFPSPMSVLASLWLACKVYPERFSEIEFEKIADAFYLNLFGKTLTQMGGKIDDMVY